MNGTLSSGIWICAHLQIETRVLSNPHISQGLVEFAHSQKITQVISCALRAALLWLGSLAKSSFRAYCGWQKTCKLLSSRSAGRQAHAGFFRTLAA